MDGEPELAYNSFFFKSALVLQRHSVYAFLSYLSIMKTLLYFYASVFFRMFYMMLVRYKRSSRFITLLNPGDMQLGKDPRTSGGEK